MRIKKLELIGFKSFKDRTVIHFDAGITGIVGPNGCGKSNIVDALVWVMGEMSAKHLRGSSMEDVIFAGAEGYAPMGLAEVSLTLENDGGPFPAQYAKNSEIMVTRRLHRSGESEYLLNKEPARLKDVQEIFMDTGAGAKGFSIIEQGAIGKIITAKPEDRRTLIEEAAGITKFKVRKRESQRKLVSTDQNLVRLADIIGELKRQLGSLERQAQRAERYRKLKQEMESLELWVTSRSYLGLREQITVAEHDLEEGRTIEASSGSDLSQSEVELETRKAEMAELEMNVTQAQTEQFEARSQVQQKELLIRELQFEIEQARRANEVTGSLLDQNQSRKDLLAQDQQTLAERVTSLTEESDRLSREFAEREGVFKTQQARISECDVELTQTRREMLTLSQGESHLDAKVVATTEQLEGIREREEQARAILLELSEKRTEFASYRDEVAGRLEEQKLLKQQTGEKLSALTAKRDELTVEIGSRREEVDSYKDQLSQVTSKLTSLEELQNNLEGFEVGVKNVIRWSRSQAEAHAGGEASFRPVAEVVEVPAEFEVAMEAALGSRLQVLLADSTDRSLSAVDYLKQSNSGRSSFMSEDLPASSVSSASSLLQEEGVKASLLDVVKAPENYQKAVAHILRDVIIVDSIRTALALRSRYEGMTFVTVDGDVLSRDGVLTGGSSESADSGMLKRRREIRDLGLQKEQWSGKLSLAQTLLKKLEDELASLNEELNSTQKLLNEQDIGVAELKKDVERAENELKNAQTAIERQEREVGQLNEQSVRIDEQLQDLTERLAEMREKKLALEGRVEELDRELIESRLGIDQLQAEVTQLRVQSAAKAQERDGVTRQLQMVEKSLAEVSDQLQQMTQETDKNAQVLSHSGQRLEEEKVALDHLIHLAEEAELKVAQVRDVFEQNSASSRELEKKVATLMHSRAQLQSKLNDAQLRLSQAQMKAENLVTHIRERYLVELSAVAEQHAVREGDIEQAENELKELRDKVAKIGEVNLSAIEEYDDLSKRYEFLTQQQQDLIDAKEQLRRVIERINRICSRRFKETFDAVNDRFTKVFPVLFGGGEATLTLIEDIEKGEMGIDIAAKPPGKKMQSVSLMSGGEKALTAVALIFSIFLVKPSPYCLLDEVDAPLDDANVFRFNDLVKEMAKRSQIIVVTHNKHTMEVSEKLYGVTMQEKGVSKMVSVSLAEMA